MGEGSAFFDTPLVHNYYSDIDRDGHKISRFRRLPRELYFPKGLYCPKSTVGIFFLLDFWVIKPRF